MKIYDQLSDKSLIYKVNHRFYEKVYEHPWMKLYFAKVDQEFITQQQTDFMTGAFGGPKTYSGRLPGNAHPHMYITDELFDIREDLVREALQELNAPDFLSEAWIKIDEAFRHSIVKQSPNQCQLRYATDEILNFANPNPLKKSA